MKKTTKPAASPSQIILAIDTTDQHQTTLGLLVSGRWHDHQAPERAQALQHLIEKFLADHQTPLATLTAVAVREGPGSYTGIRIGITTANTLAWQLSIPVLPLGEKPLDALATLKKLPKTTAAIRHVI